MVRCSTLLLAGALAAAAALAAPPATGQNQDLRLEAEFESAQVYVQAQAVYRLRFYQAVDVRDLKINGPSARLADVRPIGTGRVYEALRDGRRYRVQERSYAVFPFSSGPLALSGAHVLGRVAGAASEAADGRQPMRLEAPVQTLTVLPAPAIASAASWLPARLLTLSENWFAPMVGLRAGQALQRSIRIEAVGVDAGQIPPLQVAVAGMMVQADPPRLENRMLGERNVGVREQGFRMVALHSGDIEVPELQLRWWDLNTNDWASATLPARRLQVAAADAAPVNIQPLTPSPATTLPTSNVWQPLLAVVVVLGAGMAMAYGRRPDVRAAWRLRRACRVGTAGALRDGLLHWAATIWQQAPPLTLEALAQRWPDPAARSALLTLDRCLYGPNSGQCDEAALVAATRAINRGFRQFALSSRPTSRDP